MMGLPLAERRAVTQTTAMRDQLGSKRAKGMILDELWTNTGWHPHHAGKALKTALQPQRGSTEKSAAAEVRARCHCCARSTP